MTPPALTIAGVGLSWSIYLHGRPVAGPYTSHDNAVAALRGVERRLAPPAPLRRCLCCGMQFPSTNYRLCDTCRKEAA